MIPLQSKVGFILLEVGSVDKGVDENKGLDPAPSVLREQLRQKSAQGTTKEVDLWVIIQGGKWEGKETHEIIKWLER